MATIFTGCACHTTIPNHRVTQRLLRFAGELRFAGAAATFEQAVSFDGDMTLGLTTDDTITVKGNSTFNGTTIADLGTVSAATSITTAALVASADLDIGAYVFYDPFRRYRLYGPGSLYDGPVHE